MVSPAAGRPLAVSSTCVVSLPEAMLTSSCRDQYRAYGPAAILSDPCSSFKIFRQIGCLERRGHEVADHLGRRVGQRIDDVEMMPSRLDPHRAIRTKPSPDIGDQFALANEFGQLCTTTPGSEPRSL